MTHDQIREMIRRANPVPDPLTLEPVDASVLEATQQGRMQMQTENQVEVGDQGAHRSRGPLVGIAAAVVVLLGGLIFLMTRNDTPVAQPAPNPTLLTIEMEFQPIEPGAYFADTDGDESSTLGGTFVIEGSGWQGLQPGAVKQPVDGGTYVSLLVAEVDEVGSPACDGNVPLAAATTAETLANQFAAAAGLTVRETLTTTTAFGHDGYHLVVELAAGCSRDIVWVGPTFGRYYQSAGQVIEFWFLDVEGTPVLVETSWWPESSEEEVAELSAVLDTLVITP